MVEGYQVILASNSPRRKELLGGLGISFKVRTIQDIDESYPDTLRGEEIPIYISGKKAEAYRQTMADDELIITADT
ncbi:MAG: Maf family protein, partial [Muribaculaceae bacterium]|nr:Maf family protein [Muribaculaceae bacterium]